MGALALCSCRAAGMTGRNRPSLHAAVRASRLRQRSKPEECSFVLMTAVGDSYGQFSRRNSAAATADRDATRQRQRRPSTARTARSGGHCREQNIYAPSHRAEAELPWPVQFQLAPLRVYFGIKLGTLRLLSLLFEWKSRTERAGAITRCTTPRGLRVGDCSTLDRACELASDSDALSFEGAAPTLPASTISRVALIAPLSMIKLREWPTAHLTAEEAAKEGKAARGRHRERWPAIQCAWHPLRDSRII